MHARFTISVADCNSIKSITPEAIGDSDSFVVRDTYGNAMSLSALVAVLGVMSICDARQVTINEYVTKVLKEYESRNQPEETQIQKKEDTNEKT
jgi:hypothetical protein